MARYHGSSVFWITNTMRKAGRRDGELAPVVASSPF